MKKSRQGAQHSIYIYIFALVIMITAIYIKKSYFVDEVLSFYLANNSAGDFLYEDGVLYNPRDLFVEALSAHEGELFDYQIVWNNQANDVHPPLFYALLHTVCSFMPNVVLKWQPALINFIFGLLCLFVIRRFLLLLMNQDTARNRALVDVISLFYAVSPGILNCILLFRMYVIAMFWVVLTEYLLVRILQSVLDGKTVPGKTWAALFVLHVCCALTHYYCIMFLVFAEGALAAVLIICKKWRELVTWGVVTIASAGVAIAIFPAMLYHIFVGYHGTGAVDNALSSTFFHFAQYFSSICNGIDTEVFGGILIIVFIGTIMVAGITISGRSNKVHALLENRANLILVFIWFPCIAYLVILSLISYGTTTRYAFPIFAILYVAAMETLRRLVDHSFAHRTEIMAVVLAAMFVASYRTYEIENLHLGETLQYDIEENYNYLNAVVVYDTQWTAIDLYENLQNCARVCFIKPDEFEMLEENGLSAETNLLVFTINDSDISGLVDSMDHPMHYEQIGEHSYYKAWYCEIAD